MENKVLAKVGNYEVTEAELSFMLKSLNPQVASQFIGPEGEQRLLEEIINQKLREHLFLKKTEWDKI